MQNVLQDIPSSHLARLDLNGNGKFKHLLWPPGGSNSSERRRLGRWMEYGNPKRVTKRVTHTPRPNITNRAESA